MLVNASVGCKPRNNGATLVETAISLPIFLLLVLALIDLSRYFFIYCMLNLAAYSAADYASKLEIEVPLDNNSCYKNKEKCIDYKNTLTSIFNKALNFADLAVSRSDVSSSARLTKFTHYDRDKLGYGGEGYNLYDRFQPLDADVAFLRPGEKVLAHELSGDSEVDHPTRQFGWEIDRGWPKPGENWPTLLANHPLEVRLEADYSPFTPILPHLKIIAVQFSYRNSLAGAPAAPPPGSGCDLFPECADPRPTSYLDCKACITVRGCKSCVATDCKSICEAYVDGGCNGNGANCTYDLCYAMPPAGLGCPQDNPPTPTPTPNRPTPPPSPTPTMGPSPTPTVTPTNPPDCRCQDCNEIRCSLPDDCCSSECPPNTCKRE